MNRIISLFAVVACTGAALAQPRIVSLSSTPAVARAISADGRVVVGYSVQPSGSFSAFRWTQQDGFVDIGGGSGWLWSDARAVNADGSVVAGTSIYNPGGWWWTQPSGKIAVTIPGHGLASIDAISADGQRLGGYAFNNTTHVSDAFLYQVGAGTTFLPSPSQTMSCFAYAISPDASKVAGAGTNGGISRATLWDPLTVNRNIGSQDNRNTTVNALSSDGSAAAGQIYDTATTFSPYLWTAAGGGQELGNPAGLANGTFLAVNAAGTFAAGTSGDTTTNHRAIVWLHGLPVMDANSYLPTRGVDLTDWLLESINGMTPDGRVLVGGGIHQTPSGPQSAAFIIYLPCGTADFNGDGATGTDADIDAFFACLAGNCCPTCESPDFNGDGDVGTDADIESFFRVLAGQPC